MFQPILKYTHAAAHHRLFGNSQLRTRRPALQGRKFKENLAEASAFGASRSCGWGSGRPPPENFQASGDENQKPMTCEKHNSLLCLDLSFLGCKCSRGSCLNAIYGPGIVNHWFKAVDNKVGPTQ